MEYAELIWYAVAAVLFWICIVPSRYWLGRMYLRQGVQSLREGKYDHAICCFSKSIEWRSLNAEA